MAEKPFVFKHFVLNQDKCAMKAGTDAMILGAYVPVAQAGKILDIGTGTGILSLMIAQRSKAEIVAVDADKIAAAQAADNFRNSSWAKRIKATGSPIQDYMPEYDSLFDLIISNPPYFERNDKAVKESAAYHNRVQARSFHTLTYESLLTNAQRLLAANGIMYIIIPAAASDAFIKTAAERGLFLIDKLEVLSKAGQNAFRHILGLARKGTEDILKQLVIYEADGTYTDDYIALTQPYYAIGMGRRKQERKHKTKAL